MDHETGWASTVASCSLRLPFAMIAPAVEDANEVKIAGFTLREDVREWLLESGIDHWIDIRPVFDVERCELVVGPDTSALISFWDQKGAAIFRLFWGV